ncbi:hemophore-related protein [Nocardia sp. NPDC003482]|uniref:hemophore-related protein n=1 Tax=Nocardia sp. NPDC004068 TaxID=3364303 RepID=UPI003699176C
MKRTLAALLAGTAGAAALLVAVPGVASADGPDCGPQARAQVHAQVASRTADYLAAHPDLAAELAKVRTLPKDQRHTELQAYRQSHQQELREFRDIRQPLRDLRKACKG